MQVCWYFCVPLPPSLSLSSLLPSLSSLPPSLPFLLLLPLSSFLSLSLCFSLPLHSLYVSLYPPHIFTSHRFCLVETLSMRNLREDVKKDDATFKETSKHSSQSDAAKGFGGKYGVQKGSQDKVRVEFMQIDWAVCCPRSWSLFSASPCDSFPWCCAVRCRL